MLNRDPFDGVKVEADLGCLLAMIAKAIRESSTRASATYGTTGMSEKRLKPLPPELTRSTNVDMNQYTDVHT